MNSTGIFAGQKIPVEYIPVEYIPLEYSIPVEYIPLEFFHWNFSTGIFPLEFVVPLVFEYSSS